MSERIQDLMHRIAEAGLKYPLRILPAFAINTKEIVYKPEELAPALERAYALSPIEEVRVQEAFVIEK